MRNGILVALLFGSGCSMTSYGTQAPMQWDFQKSSKEETYAAHQIECDDDGEECKKGGQPMAEGTLVPAFARYEESRELLNDQGTRNGVLVGLGAVSAIAAFWGSSRALGGFADNALAPGSGNPDVVVGVSTAGLGVLCSVASLVVMAMWDPAEELDDAYNAALRQDLERAYATQAAPGLPAQAVSVR